MILIAVPEPAPFGGERAHALTVSAALQDQAAPDQSGPHPAPLPPHAVFPAASAGRLLTLIAPLGQSPVAARHTWRAAPSRAPPANRDIV
ncbi:MAG: hypothetical protein Kow0013_15740 [Pararhodobacter sp.]